MLRSIISICFVISAGFVFGQTKKIANASHASSGPSFNWTSSDNLGFIADYDRFPKIEPEAKGLLDSIQVDTLPVEEPTPVDTAVYKQVSQNSTLVIDEATPKPGSQIPPKKKSTPVNGKKKKKKKHKKRKLFKSVSLDSEIGDFDKPQKTADHSQAGLSWLSLLLMIPLGILVFKKS